MPTVATDQSLKRTNTIRLCRFKWLSQKTQPLARRLFEICTHFIGYRILLPINWNQTADQKPNVNLTRVDAQNSNLSALGLFIPEKQREDRAPLSSQMWHLGLTDADPAWSSRMRLLSLYLGQMLHDRRLLVALRAWLFVGLRDALCFPHLRTNMFDFKKIF